MQRRRAFLVLDAFGNNPAHGAMATDYIEIPGLYESARLN